MWGAGVALHNAHWTMHTELCTLRTVQPTLHTDTAQLTLHTEHCKLCTVHCTLYSREGENFFPFWLAAPEGRKYWKIFFVVKKDNIFF